MAQSENRSQGPGKDLSTWLLCIACAFFAIMMPLFLVQLEVPFVRLMDEVYHPIVLLQLYVFTASAALVLLLSIKLWQYHRSDRSNRSWQKLLPFVMGILITFQILALIRHHDARSWDYRCYEAAAQAIVDGVNPYGHCYIYFPTPAQAMASLAQFLLWVTDGVVTAFVAHGDTTTGQAAVWDLVFYFYEATQLLLVALAFTLSYRLARVLALTRLQATAVVTALFLFNNPLLATLKHNQVNLWVLDLVLLAILAIQRYPVWSGLFIAIGAHIKLYPLALLLPWALKRKWRALVSATAGLIAIVLMQTGGASDLTLWQQFIAFAGTFPRGTFLRDNSLHSLVYNSLGHLKWLIDDGSFSVNELYVSRLVLIGMGFLGLLYLWRFVQREQLALQAEDLAISNEGDQGALSTIFMRTRPVVLNQRTVLMGHAMDALALALIASPVVWEHHYLLAMPIVIWGVAQARTERQLWRIALSCVLIFVIPTFDVYPFSYHRLAGLLLLLGTLSPMVLAQMRYKLEETTIASPNPVGIAPVQQLPARR